MNRVREFMFARRLMGSVLLAGAMVLTLCSTGRSQVKVTAGDVKDTRRSDGFFNKLEIDLKISGQSLAGAKGVRVLVTRAVDETGRDLVEEKDSKNGFEEVDSSNDGETKVEIELKSPERKAMSVQEVSGAVEIFAPSKDPKATLTVPDFQKSVGKLLPYPSLKAAGVEVTVWTKDIYDARKKAEEDRIKTEMEAKAKKAEQSGNPLDVADLLQNALTQVFGGLFNSFAEMGENDIAFNVNDPESKLIVIDIQDQTGKPIEHNGRMTIGGDPRTIIYSFEQRLPPTARIRMYLLTPKSLTKVPFKLVGIPLP
jgi:hypothetical protein